MKRFEPKQSAKGGDYFPPKAAVEFIPTGSILFDCTIGGGWALGRTGNIVGDKSVGKTLMAIEACANFARKYPDGRVWYREAEAAFDTSYAEALGLPVSKVDFGKQGTDTHWDTIEAVVRDFELRLEQAADEKVPGLYIIDSLDALTSEAALKRKIGQQAYPEKPKILGQMFSKNTRLQREAKVNLLIVSQVRDNIGVTFGRKYKRTGGKALDFYASQVVYVSHIETVYREIGNVKRATAVRVRIKCDKNKIAMPFRECEATLRFGYGMDDLDASLRWLEEVKMLERVGIVTKGKDAKAVGAAMGKYLTEATKMSQPEYDARIQEVRMVVEGAWNEIEKDFLPKRRKYA